jgi:ribonucleotide reductase alpha subunit
MREDILKKRYYRKNAQGEPIEKWPDLCRRVAKAVALDEAEERMFFQAMVYALFLPNTPALTNAGRDSFTLSACFLPRLTNGLENILNCIRDMALIQKMGGGTGFCFDDPDLPAQLPENYRPTFLIEETHPDVALVRANKPEHADLRTVDSDGHFEGVHIIQDNMSSIFSFEALLKQPKYIGFSSLRAKGRLVASTQGEASGPASFMKVWDEMIGYLKNPITSCSTVRIFNAATEAIKQGSTRRGANMGVLRVDHPDVMEFALLKEKQGELTNFNLSIAMTDEFMAAVDKKADWILKDADGQAVQSIPAKALWDKIIYSAWLNGGSGAIFIDTMNAANPTPDIGKYRATNPCGEQVLLEDEACILASVNLAKVLTKDNEVDWKKLEETARTAVRFLDNAVDRQHYPTPAIATMHKANRKIGLGVMGWADVLVKMKLSYASQEAVDLADRIMEFPLGIFAIAIGTAALPSFSKHVAAGRTDELKSGISFSLRLMLFLTIPSMAALMALNAPIISVLFQRGAFDADAAVKTGQALFC